MLSHTTVTKTLTKSGFSKNHGCVSVDARPPLPSCTEYQKLGSPTVTLPRPTAGLRPLRYKNMSS